MKQKWMISMLVLLMMLIVAPVSAQGLSTQPVMADHDAMLENAIAQQAAKDGCTAENIRYMANRFDLNGDGKDEVFVFMQDSYYRGSGGFTTYLFAPSADGFERIGRFTLVNAPVIVSSSSTNGWRDIVIRVSGGGIKPGYAVMRHDGQRYPVNPTTQPMLAADQLNGTMVLQNEENGVLILKMK